jgi:hypothetical protein
MLKIYKRKDLFRNRSLILDDSIIHFQTHLGLTENEAVLISKFCYRDNIFYVNSEKPLCDPRYC